MDLSLSQVTPANEAELLSGLRRHDPAAIGDLYDRYGKLLFSLILNIVGDRDEAEALLTEALLKACNRLKSFECEQFAFRPWLLLLARNHALEFRKGVSAMKGRDRPWDILQCAAVYEEAGTCDCSPATLPEQKAFVTLPELSRLVLELAWFEGMSLEEIAPRVNVSVAEAATMAEDSLEKLREA